MARQQKRGNDRLQALEATSEAIGRLTDEITARTHSVVNHAAGLLPNPVRQVVDGAIDRGRSIVTDGTEAISSLGSQLVGDLDSLRTDKGRKRLATRLEKEAKKLAQQPFKWLEFAKPADLTALQRRLKAVERRLDELDKPKRSSRKQRQGRRSA